MFRLRYKIFILISFILVVTGLLLTLSSIQLFEKDKISYIYQTQSILNQSLGSSIGFRYRNLNRILDQVSKKTNIAWGSLEKEAQNLGFFFIEIFLIKEDEVNKTIYFNTKLQENDFFSKEEINKIRKKAKAIAPSYKHGDSFEVAPLPNYQNSSLYLATKRIQKIDQSNQSKNYLYVAILGDTEISKLLGKNESKQFKSILVNDKSEVLFTTFSQNTDQVIEKLLENLKTSQGVKEFKNNNITFLASYQKIDFLNIYLISLIPKVQAMGAITKMKYKSILIATMLLLTFLILSLFFSNALTKSIDLLFKATKKVAAGNFDIKLNIKSKDEMGYLSEAFESMSLKIKDLIRENIERARMEKELEMAKMVQENLIPPSKMENDFLKIESHYQSASECGGDWWGEIELEDSYYLLIGDVTGHGASAAMITACVQSAVTVIKENIHNLNLATPNMIMKTLNSSVYYASKGKVRMSFLIVKVDKNSSQIQYCNAGHEMPFIFRFETEDFESLTGAPNSNLGKAVNTSFTDHTDSFKENDILFLYTDGLVENRNTKKEEFGERRLFRILKKAMAKKSPNVKEDVITSYSSFVETEAPDDDVTFIVGRRK